MIMVIFLLAMCFIALSFSSIMRFIRGKDRIAILRFAILLSVSVIGTAAVVFLIRDIYVPSDGDIPDWWKSLQGIDAYLTSILLLVTGIGIIGIHSWYKERIWERFTYISGIQLILISALRGIRLIILDSHINWILHLGVIAAGGLLIFYSRHIFEKRIELEKYLSSQRW